MVRLVRERHPCLMLPVILVSANSREEHVVEGLQAGCLYNCCCVLGGDFFPCLSPVLVGVHLGRGRRLGWAGVP